MTRPGLGVVLTTAASLLIAGCASNGGVDRDNAAAANANVGADYLQKGQNERARRAFDKALSYDSDNFTANWGMAVVADRMDEPDRARRYYDKTLGIRSVPTVLNSYAAFNCQHGETDRGIAYFDKALDAGSPGDRADTLANAGLCLYRADRIDEATTYFERALAIDPEQATALTRRATIAYHAKNYLSARAFIERADAATTLNAEQLRLAAHIETALGDRQAAQRYLERAAQPSKAVPAKQRESVRP